MLDLVDGLPWHPLVVHAVVVLLPLAVLGTIAIAVVPRWRVTYGPLVVAVTAVGTALIPIATESGEALERHVGDPGRHAQLGEQLIWFALPLLILDLVVAFRARGESGARTGATGVVVVLAVVAALATAVQVYRVGDSGARAVWADEVSAPQ